MKKIFKKKTPYLLIVERGFWPKKGPLSYEGHYNSKKKRVKKTYNDFRRHLDHWLIKKCNSLH